MGKTKGAINYNPLEIKIMKEMFDTGHDDKSIAKKLMRSRRSVEMKRIRIGLFRTERSCKNIDFYWKENLITEMLGRDPKRLRETLTKTIDKTERIVKSKFLKR